MSDKLGIIKQLRASGATIRMIDDVAAYLEAHGGYDSPVFVATVEFIIKIRQMLQSVLVQQEQVVSVADKFTEKDTENVNFGAARSGVENDGEIDDYEREKILNHIVEIEAQHNSYLENNTYKQSLNREVEERGTRGQKKREGKRGNGLLEKLFKISALISQRDKQQKNFQTQQQEGGQQVAVQQNARQNASQQQQQQQAVQTVQRSSVTRMNIMRMKLMNVLKTGKDRTVMGDASRQSKSEAKKINPQPNQEYAKTEIKPRREELAPAKDKRTVNEITISKVIDEAVKASKAQKKTVEEKPPVEKGKFEKKAGEKTGPRADDAKVAEMAAKDAINKLQKSGVTTGAPDMKTKKEIDTQIAQMQATGGGATPKLQR